MTISVASIVGCVVGCVVGCEVVGFEVVGCEVVGFVVVACDVVVVSSSPLQPPMNVNIRTMQRKIGTMYFLTLLDIINLLLIPIYDFFSAFGFTFHPLPVPPSYCLPDISGMAGIIIMVSIRA